MRITKTRQREQETIDQWEDMMGIEGKTVPLKSVLPCSVNEQIPSSRIVNHQALEL
jgi:hypothetical protein